MRITLLGEPLSVNHIWKSHCKFGHPTVYLTPAGRALKEAYQWQAQSQYRGKPLAVALKLTVTVYFGTRRRKNIDNSLKLVLDAMKGIVFLDDSQVMKLSIEKNYDKARPRIEIVVERLNSPDSEA